MAEIFRPIVLTPFFFLTPFVALGAQDGVGAGARVTLEPPPAPPVIHLRAPVITRYTPLSPYPAIGAQDGVGAGARLAVARSLPKSYTTPPLPVVGRSPYVAVTAHDQVTGTLRPLNAPIAPPNPATTQPVPAGYPYPLDLRLWPQGPNTALLLTPQIVVRVRPVVVTRYTPVSPWAAVTAQPVGSPLGTRTTVTGTPKPARTDPVPRGPVYPISLRSIHQRGSLALLTAPPPVIPKLRPPLITRYAKRATIAAVQSQSSVIGANVNTTLLPPSGGYQLVSGDWPNPDGRIYPSSLRTWTQSGRLPLLGSAPKAQIDWPNPRGYAYPTSLRTWLQEPSPALLYVAPQDPLRPLDWPNPRGPQYPIDLRTWVRNPQTLKGQDEFFGLGGPTFDWPNPIGYAYPVSLRTWTQDATTRLAGADSVRPFDWPNPRGYAYPTSLRTWTDSLELAILSAVPVPPFDWPNPAPAVGVLDLRTIAQSMPLPILEAITATPPLGVNIDLTVVLATDWLQLTVCVNKALELTVVTNCTIELKVP